MNSCKGCKFARPLAPGFEQEHHLECRRYAPRPAITAEVFPREVGGCGEYVSEEKKATASELDRAHMQGYSEGRAEMKRRIVKVLEDAHVDSGVRAVVRAM